MRSQKHLVIQKFLERPVKTRAFFGQYRNYLFYEMLRAPKLFIAKKSAVGLKGKFRAPDSVSPRIATNKLPGIIGFDPLRDTSAN